MLTVVAELSYYAAGSNFNLQMGGYKQVLMLIQSFLGEHCGPRCRFNVSVIQGDSAQWVLMVVANSRFSISGLGKAPSSYVTAVQQCKWRVADRG